MLTNKQIHTLLLENKDINAFKKYVGFKSRQAMEFRLRSEEPKNNLDGQYRAFILKQKLPPISKDEYERLIREKEQGFCTGIFTNTE